MKCSLKLIFWNVYHHGMALLTCNSFVFKPISIAIDSLILSITTCRSPLVSYMLVPELLLRQTNSKDGCSEKTRLIISIRSWLYYFMHNDNYWLSWLYIVMNSLWSSSNFQVILFFGTNKKKGWGVIAAIAKMTSYRPILLHCVHI